MNVVVVSIPCPARGILQAENWVGTDRQRRPSHRARGARERGSGESIYLGRYRMVGTTGLYLSTILLLGWDEQLDSIFFFL